MSTRVTAPEPPAGAGKTVLRAARETVRPRALLITPVWPDARGVGPAQRAFQWLTRLARTHAVDLLVVWRIGGVPAAPEPPLGELPVERCVQVAPTPRRRHYWTHLGWRDVRARCRGRAGSIGPRPEWGVLTGDACRRIAAGLSDRSYGRAVCFRVQLADYADYVVAAGWVDAAAMEIDCDDLESSTRRSIADGLALRGRSRAAWRVRRQARRAEKLERELAGKYPLAVAAPEDLGELSSRREGAVVRAVPNLLARMPRNLAAGDPHRLLFVGSLGYFPNEDAVRFLIEEVLPVLREEDRRWTLVVAGRGAPAALAAALAAAPGVEFHGAVAELEPLYETAGIAAGPVRSGGGTKIKVAEGLAHGRPLIATSHAARGWELRDGEHFRRADSAAEWIAACRALAADQELAARLANAGRAHIARHYVMPSDPAGGDAGRSGARRENPLQ